MATTSQLRGYWADYKCNPSKMVRVGFPGVDRTWNLLVADKSAPIWEQFAAVMRKHNYLLRETASGSYNCRKINLPSGTTNLWSLHSYGIAVDLNPSKNPYKKPLTHNYPAAFIRDVEAIRTNGKQAIQWGGRWSTPDAMHWQINVAPHDIPQPVGDDEMSLKRGAKGPAVTKLQAGLLAEKPGCLPKYGADGDYGTETETAVKDYQARVQLPATGEADGITFSLLMEYVADRVGAGGVSKADVDAAIKTHAANPDAHHD